MAAIVRYTVLRLVLFLISLQVVWVAGLPILVTGLVAVVVAAALSYILLPRSRAAAAQALVELRAARTPGFAQDDAAYEDALDEAARSAVPPTGPLPGPLHTN